MYVGARGEIEKVILSFWVRSSRLLLKNTKFARSRRLSKAVPLPTMEFLVGWLKIFQLRVLTSLNWPEYHCEEIVSQIFSQLRLDNNNLLQCRLKYLKIETSVEAPSGVEELTRIEAKKVRHPLWLPRPSTCKCWHWHFPIQPWQQILDKLEPPSKLVAKLNNAYFVQLSPSIPGLMFSEVVKACP